MLPFFVVTVAVLTDPLPVAVSSLAIAARSAPCGRLREQVELEAVARALVDIAGNTVRPSLATVWVRIRPA